LPQAGKAVVITGVSSGIGFGTASVLLSAGFEVFGSVRTTADAERSKAQLGSGFHALQFDVTRDEQIEEAARQVGERLQGRTLAGLVNNAGVAFFGALAHMPTGDFRRQLEVNLVGPMITTRAFLPLLGLDTERRGKPGRIIQISSMGGKLGGPFLGPYVASKHGLEGMSESLRRELMLYGIDVIIVGPGSVATPIWDKAEEADDIPGLGTPFEPAIRRLERSMLQDGRKGFSPEHVGRVVLTALTSKRPKTRYAVVPSRFTSWTLPRLLPARIVDRILARRLGLLPGKRRKPSSG
jgi:NAD(P)-dependent dehydrogenase (short-subunit alcohol dehydrogenase family)